MGKRDVHGGYKLYVRYGAGSVVEICFGQKRWILTPLCSIPIGRAKVSGCLPPELDPLPPEVGVPALKRCLLPQGLDPPSAAPPALTTDWTLVMMPIGPDGGNQCYCGLFGTPLSTC